MYLSTLTLLAIPSQLSDSTRWERIAVLLILLLGILSGCSTTNQPSPLQTIPPPNPEQSRAVEQRAIVIRLGQSILSSYTGSYALLIGESDYTNGWSDLESIPGELQQVESLLKSKGFHVEKSLNLNAEQLRDRFKRFVDQYGFKENNRLLFFYSGHGETRKDKGYLVPTDAPNPKSDEIGFLQKALTMGEILAMARRIRAKHVLFLFDSCFSGMVFKAKGLPKTPRQISKMAKLPVRQFLTAGSANEPVPAKSVFTPAFVDALRYGEGDLTKDGYVTGQELGLYLQSKVPQHARQTPQYGKISDYDLSRGDFVFVVGEGSQGSKTRPPQEPTPTSVSPVPVLKPDKDGVANNPDKDTEQDCVAARIKFPLGGAVPSPVTVIGTVDFIQKEHDLWLMSYHHGTGAYGGSLIDLTDNNWEQNIKLVGGMGGDKFSLELILLEKDKSHQLQQLLLKQHGVTTKNEELLQSRLLCDQKVVELRDDMQSSFPTCKLDGVVSQSRIFDVTPTDDINRVWVKVYGNQNVIPEGKYWWAGTLSGDSYLPRLQITREKINSGKIFQETMPIPSDIDRKSSKVALLEVGQETNELFDNHRGEPLSYFSDVCIRATEVFP